MYLMPHQNNRTKPSNAERRLNASITVTCDSMVLSAVRVQQFVTMYYTLAARIRQRYRSLLHPRQTFLLKMHTVHVPETPASPSVRCRTALPSTPPWGALPARCQHAERSHSASGQRYLQSACVLSADAL
ncbi:hypothetical protein Anapl_09661 [Anas platyrhynchos]|uniref:Uncharacterized protein n=1 Tax=Anas platyrhynchos TaxID=8839 RepID=R0KRK3_ANAPL|nr:hypothetical protein Anapl_09661 [Anas platyrhynchos]